MTPPRVEAPGAGGQHAGAEENIEHTPHDVASFCSTPAPTAMAPPFDLPRRPRLRNRARRCYELSGQAALNDPAWVLVHGTVLIPESGGLRTGHAWIEREGWVYDAVADHAFYRDEYLVRLAAVENGRWQGGKPVADAILAHNHWGPWV